jgi:cytochrome b561
MTTHYTRTVVVLHWLVALLIFAAFPIGLLMSDMPLSPLKLKLVSYHKWLGVTVFLFVLVRLAWRATHTPPLPVAMPAWQQRAANGVHYLLYLLIFIIPLTGWLMSSAKGLQTAYLGVLPLPDLLGKDKALGKVLEEVHAALNYGMLALVILHIGAALQHQFIVHDGVLARMLPFLDKETRR